MRRKHYVQLVFCPPLTRDEDLRRRMDKKAVSLNRRKGHRRFSDDILKAWGPIAADLRELGKRALKKLPKWEIMVWITDCEHRRRAQ